MRKRTFIFEGTDTEAQMMSVILHHYAEVAYPLGGSDCAAASREAVQTLVNKFRQSECVEIEISRRQRPMLKTAVKWFYTDSEYANPKEVMFQKLMEYLE